MKISQNPKMRRTILSFFALVFFSLIPLLYQNCSAPLEEACVSGEDCPSPASAGLPFETKVDHIAYMSCSNMSAGYNPSTYFTFKVGAYEAGSGIRLSDSYRHNTRNFTVSERVASLGSDEVTKDVFLALNVRNRLNFSQNQNGNFFSNDFIESLTAPGPAGELVATKEVYKSVFTSVGNARIADTIEFTNSEFAAASLRDNLNRDDERLMLHYNKVGAAPEDIIVQTQNKAVGSSFKINFRMGFGASGVFTAGPVRTLGSITEYNLLDGPTGSPRKDTSWTCRADWAFMIVKPSDLGSKVICPQNNPSVPWSEPVPANADQALALQELRKILPATAWYVNLQYRCLIPRDQSNACYGPSAAVVNYAGGTCDPNAGTCPHYFSLCKRN